MNNNIPLCVKLNRTLITTNVIWEAVIQLLGRNPFFIFCLPLWLSKGHFYFEEKVFEESKFNIKYLQFRKKLCNLAEAHKDNGRKVILIDTNYSKYLELIVANLKAFDSFIARENNSDLLKTLKKNFTEGYDLITASSDDMSLCASARQCYLVEPSASFFSQVSKIADIETVFKTRRDKIKIFFQTIHIERAWCFTLLFLPIFLFPQKILQNLPILINVFVIYFLVSTGLFITYDICNINVIRQKASQKPRHRQNTISTGLFAISTGLKLAFSLVIAGIFLSLINFTAVFNIILFLFIMLSMLYIVVIAVAWNINNNYKISAVRYLFWAILAGLALFASKQAIGI